MRQPIHRRVVPESYVQVLYEYLEAHGYEPESVLGDPWPDRGSQNLDGIEVEHWEQLLETAAEHLADPCLGLHVGQTITSHHLGILGSILLACENMGAASRQMERYLRLVFDVIPMTVRSDNGWFDITWDNSEYLPGWRVNETGYTVIVQFCRNLARGTVKPLLVDFIDSAPADITPYETYFGCPVRFNQAEAVIRFSNELLELPLKSPDPALIALLEQHADHLLEQLPQQNEIVEQVRKAIVRLLREGEPDIERISAQLCCSTRTLQRKLREAGTGFRAELNLVRYELAQSYLLDPRLQITDISMLLGYSEHSAFSRAFKSWSGESPQEARNRGTFED